MATITETLPATLQSLTGKHDFTTLIGNTRPPSDGSKPHMDDLASENPLYRDLRRATVFNVRGSENQFTLEEHGFQYYKLPDIPGAGIVDFQNENDQMILGLYYPGMAKWFAGV